MRTHEKSLARRLLFATVVASFLYAAQTACADPNVYQNTLRSTTWVLAKNSDGTASGTGVLIDAERKLVVTNAHVVGDARNTVVFFSDMQSTRPKVERKYYLDNVSKLGIRGRVVAVDRKRDLALIQLSKLPDGATAIEMATESIGPGEPVQSIGNPGSSEALWVYTSGTVRSIYNKKFRTGAGEHNFKVVETQSPINSGDSGGPVVNKDGQLVAIAQAIAPKARLVSYCVDITEVKLFLDSPWKAAPLPTAEILKNTDLEFSKHKSGHYEVQLAPEKGKKVSVFVTKDIEYYERADVRKIWTLTQVTQDAPNSETSMKLLQQSARTKIGAWTIEQDPTGKYMLIYMVKLDATASAEAVKSTVQYVAKLSVAMKKELSPKENAKDASDTLSEWLAN